MRERIVITIICALILVGGSVFAYYISYAGNNDFNFYKAELWFENMTVHERLGYAPNNAHHTLYRTFVTPLTIDEATGDAIQIQAVNCSRGRPYARTEAACFTFAPEIIENSCEPYTEANEYGCTFGNELGFTENQDYTIGASYTLSANTLFRVNDALYLKFVAYTPQNHVGLRQGVNFFLMGNVVAQERYLPREHVIIYVPYTDSTEGKNIVDLETFAFDRTLFFLFFALLAIIPALLVFSVWFIWGREQSYADIPEELSTYPQERKGWEVAAFFTPPFSALDSKFIATLLIDFYHKKIIDIRVEKIWIIKQTLIKILNERPSGLDEIEKDFFDLLSYVSRESKKDTKKTDGYVNFSTAAKSLTTGFEVRKRFKKLNAELKSRGTPYLSKTGNKMIVLGFVVLAIVYSFVAEAAGYSLLGLAMFAFLFIGLSLGASLIGKSSLFTRHKAEYYKEYQRWRAFKNYLEGAPSIKEGSHKAVILWEHYMVYALALGVSEKALKELRINGLISEQEYSTAANLMLFSRAFGGSRSTGSSGRGFGGAGGGGVGGGGGGGR